MMKLKKLISCAIATAVCTLTFISSQTAINAKEFEATEIIAQRTEFEKTFDIGNGKETKIVGTAPLHYYDAGEWREIDNSLVKDNNGNYTNKASSFNVTLASDTNAKTLQSVNKDNELVKMSSGKYDVSWSFIADTSAKTAISKKSTIEIKKSENIAKSISEESNLKEKTYDFADRLESGAIYKSIFNGVDVDIDISPVCVKETIIVNDRKSIRDTFSYYINSKGLKAKKNADNSIHFYDAENNECFFIPTMFMFDSSDECELNYDIDVELKEYKNGYVLTIIPDKKWLNDSSRKFPVKIDPQVYVYNQLTCTYTSQISPNSSGYGSNYLLIGGNSGVRNESFLSVPLDLSSFSKQTEIVDAKCKMFFSSNDRPGTNPQINVSLIKSLPASYSNLTWNNTQNLNVVKYNTFQVPEYSSGYKDIDIKELVQNWMNCAQTGGTAGADGPQYGIRLSAQETSCRTLYGFSSSSSHAPYFEITYSTNEPYKLNYSFGKFNTVNDTSNNTSVLNFKERMNCYAYALQMYYKGNPVSGDSNYYYLIPGQIGIGQTDSSYQYNIPNYGTLYNTYHSFSSLTDFVAFTDEQMRKDAKAMNYNITNLNNSYNWSTSDKTVLSNNFNNYINNSYNQNSGRIIAMVAGENYYGSKDFHFYVRHGNGTCNKPGHGSKCSLWSHKQGGNIVTTSSLNTSPELCDQTICEYSVYPYPPSNIYYYGPYFYNISQNAHIYDSWYYYGRNSYSTGTSFHNE